MPTEFDERRIQTMRKLEANGWNRTEIAEKYGITRARVAQLLGHIPNVGGRKPRVVYVLDGPWQKAEKRAKKLKLFIRSGPTAGSGSVATMIEKIGTGELVVSYAKDEANDGTEEESPNTE